VTRFRACLRAWLIPVLVVPFLWFGAGATQADSGFCGVRAGQFWAGFDEVYEVRNKCSSALHFKVYLVTYGHYAFYQDNTYYCGKVPANSTRYYYYPHTTQNWVIESC